MALHTSSNSFQVARFAFQLSSLGIFRQVEFLEKVYTKHAGQEPSSFLELG